MGDLIKLTGQAKQKIHAPFYTTSLWAITAAIVNSYFNERAKRCLQCTAYAVPMTDFDVRTAEIKPTQLLLPELPNPMFYGAHYN